MAQVLTQYLLKPEVPLPQEQNLSQEHSVLVCLEEISAMQLTLWVVYDLTATCLPLPPSVKTYSRF